MLSKWRREAREDLSRLRKLIRILNSRRFQLIAEQPHLTLEEALALYHEKPTLTDLRREARALGVSKYYLFPKDVLKVILASYRSPGPQSSEDLSR